MEPKATCRLGLLRQEIVDRIHQHNLVQEVELDLRRYAFVALYR